MASKGNFAPTWTTVTPIKPKEKQTTVMPIVPPLLGPKLVTPVLPPVSTKTVTPIPEPTNRKTETPITPPLPKKNVAESKSKDRSNEITGTEVWNTSSKEKQIKFLEQMKKSYPDAIMYDPRNENIQWSIRSFDARNLANPFRKMELAGLGREYTGKLYGVMRENYPYGQVEPNDAFNAAAALKTLKDPAHIETFLALVPGWTGSYSDLAAASKTL